MSTMANFCRIMEAERLIHEHDPFKLLPNYLTDSGYHPEHMPDYFYHLANCILQIAKSSIVPRSSGVRYGTFPGNKAPESVGAHTNLMIAIIDYALHSIYGEDFGDPEADHAKTIDGYTYREVIDAARIHDLPENEAGDIPDNGSRDEDSKIAHERGYFRRFLDFSPPFGISRKRRIFELLCGMEENRSPTCRMLYLADKASALIAMLAYDREDCSHRMSPDSEYASDRDIHEMQLCDFVDAEYRRKASEMWAIDYFHIRDIDRLDDTGFFRAVIVMATLIVNGQWYEWRERDYEAGNKPIDAEKSPTPEPGSYL